MSCWLLAISLLFKEEPTANSQQLVLVGDVAQRESASLARRRSGVQVPSSPPKFKGEALDKIPFLVYTIVCKRAKG